MHNAPFLAFCNTHLCLFQARISSPHCFSEFTVRAVFYYFGRGAAEVITDLIAPLTEWQVMCRGIWTPAGLTSHPDTCLIIHS